MRKTSGSNVVQNLSDTVALPIVELWRGKEAVKGSGRSSFGQTTLHVKEDPILPQSNDGVQETTNWMIQFPSLGPSIVEMFSFQLRELDTLREMRTR